MGHIQVNFDDVPDRMEPLAAGVYVMVVKEANIEPTKDGKGEKVVVQMAVNDGPNEGRMVFDHLSLKLPIGLKALMKSAGLKVGPSGVNTEDLIGKIVRVRVKARTYKDPESGEVKETSSVAEYLVA